METDIQKAVAPLIAEQRSVEILRAYPEILSIPEVCEILGTDRKTLSRWRASGSLKAREKALNETDRYTYRKKDVKPILVSRILAEIEVWDVEAKIRETIADMRLRRLLSRACKHAGILTSQARAIIDEVFENIGI